MELYIIIGCVAVLMLLGESLSNIAYGVVTRFFIPCMLLGMLLHREPLRPYREADYFDVNYSIKYWQKEAPGLSAEAGRISGVKLF